MSGGVITAALRRRPLSASNITRPAPWFCTRLRRSCVVSVLFYAEAEEILSKVPRLGLGVVMRQRAGGPTKWDIMSMGRLVRNLRGALGLPDTFTLDACRHGGMTE